MTAQRWPKKARYLLDSGLSMISLVPER